MNASKNWCLGSLVVTLATLALVGCGGAKAPQDTATVGTAGATLSAGRVTLTIPAGALGSATQITLREAEPHHAGRAVRVEIEPRGLQLGRAANLAVQVDDSNGRVRMIDVSDDASEHLAQVEVEDHGRHAYKTAVGQLGSYEVEVEHLAACTTACAANEECDDGVCKPHVEDAVGAACSAVCDSGLECDDGACKPHGGGSGDGVATPAACTPGCASGLECDDGICKPDGGAVTPAPGTPAPAACNPGCDAGLECDNGVCRPHGGK
jgi:hypothetical protein